MTTKTLPEAPPENPSPDPRSQVEQDIAKALRTQRDQMTSGKRERSTGFAKLQKETEETALLSQFSTAEKRLILETLLKQQDTYPEKTQLRMQQLEMLRIVLDETMQQTEEPKTFLGRAARAGSWLREKIGLSAPIKEQLKRLKREIETFYENDYPTIVKLILRGNTTVRSVIRNNKLLTRAVKKYGFDFYDPEHQEDILIQYDQIIAYLRGAKSYETAAVVAERLLDTELAGERVSMPGDVKQSVTDRVNREMAAIKHQHEAAWKQSGMTAEQIDEFVAKLKQDKLVNALNAEAARTIKPAIFSGAKKDIWKKYNDMLDPKGEWFNIKDATWDTIYEEVAINAPLIVASGGVASLVRAGVSAGAKAVIGRMALRSAIKAGTEVGGRTLVAHGSTAVAKWAGGNLAKKGALMGAGLFTEGAAFEITHLSLQGEWLGSMPDWGSRVLWTSATLGLFHGAGRLGERAFTKPFLENGQVVMRGGRAVTQDVLLGKCVSWITNTAARETAKQLMLKGHIEAACMMVIAAAHNGAAEGNLDQFFENFSDELLHSYITVGALKVSHAGLATAKGQLFKPGVTITRAVEETARARDEVRPIEQREEPTPTTERREDQAQEDVWDDDPIELPLRRGIRPPPPPPTEPAERARWEAQLQEGANGDQSTRTYRSDEEFVDALSRSDDPLKLLLETKKETFGYEPAENLLHLFSQTWSRPREKFRELLLCGDPVRNGELVHHLSEVAAQHPWYKEAFGEIRSSVQDTVLRLFEYKKSSRLSDYLDRVESSGRKIPKDMQNYELLSERAFLLARECGIVEVNAEVITAASGNLVDFARKNPELGPVYIALFKIPPSMLTQKNNAVSEATNLDALALELPAFQALRESGFVTYANDSPEMQRAATRAIEIHLQYCADTVRALEFKKAYEVADGEFMKAATKGIMEGIRHPFGRDITLEKLEQAAANLGITLDTVSREARDIWLEGVKNRLIFRSEKGGREEICTIMSKLQFSPAELQKLYQERSYHITSAFAEGRCSDAMGEVRAIFGEKQEGVDKTGRIIAEVLKHDEGLKRFQKIQESSDVPRESLAKGLNEYLERYVADKEECHKALRKAAALLGPDLPPSQETIAQARKILHVYLGNGQMDALSVWRKAFSLEECLDDPEVHESAKKGIVRVLSGSAMTYTTGSDGYCGTGKAKELRSLFGVSDEEFAVCLRQATLNTLETDSRMNLVRELRELYQIDSILASPEASEAARKGMNRTSASGFKLTHKVHILLSYAEIIPEVAKESIEKAVTLLEQDLSNTSFEDFYKEILHATDLRDDLLSQTLSDVKLRPMIREHYRTWLEKRAGDDPEDRLKKLAKLDDQECLDDAKRETIRQTGSMQPNSGWLKIAKALRERFSLPDDLEQYREQTEIGLRGIIDTFELKTLEDLQKFKEKEWPLVSFVTHSEQPLALGKADLKILKDLKLFRLSFLEAEQVKRASGEENFLQEVVKTKNYDRMIEILKSTNDEWKDENNVSGPYEQGVQLFGEGNRTVGHERMLRFMDRPQLTRHDALHAFGLIMQMQQASGLTPTEFYANVLAQIAKDGSTYDSGTAHHRLNSIASTLDLDFQKTLDLAAEFSDIVRLQELAQAFRNPRDIFVSWSQLKRYAEFSRQLQRTKGLKQLQEYRRQGKHQLCDFAETLAFHPDSEVNIAQVMSFVTEPRSFLDQGDTHTPAEVHSRKKPSNYIDIPHLDLTAEELRDGLVEGGLDALQEFRPLEIRYSVPRTFADGITLREIMKSALGERSKKIKGKARDAKMLFDGLNKALKSCNLNVVRYLAGEEVPTEKRIEMEKQLETLLYDPATGVARPEMITVVARMNLKSDPAGVLAGNDTACCMPFGSGKNNVYMFNPATAIFTVQIEEPAGKPRTIAQSLMTRDRDIKKNIADVRSQLEKSGGKMDDIIPADVLQAEPAYAAADNVEMAKNFIRPDYQGLVKRVYTDFFHEYMQRFAKADHLQNTLMPIGMGHSGAVSDLPKIPNTFAPEAPVGYSDKTHREVYALTPRQEIPETMKIIVEKPKKKCVRRNPSVRGVEELTFADTLAVAYLEGKAYSDNTSLISYIHNMENSLIAKDINNVMKNRPNMSFKYSDDQGRARGYLLAYEGRIKEQSSQFSGSPVIFISDLASDRQSKRAGGSLIKAFVERYKEEYLAKGKLIPIYAEARAQTAFRIIQRQFEALTAETGIAFELVELPTHAIGADTMHPVIIRPKPKT